MKYSYAFLAPALAAVVNAQTAPNFPVQVDTLLVVDYQNTSISVEPAGVTLNREGKPPIKAASRNHWLTRENRCPRNTRGPRTCWSNYPNDVRLVHG